MCALCVLCPCIVCHSDCFLCLLFYVRLSVLINIAYIHILYFVFSCIVLPFWRNKVHIYYGPNTAMAQTQTTNFFFKTVSPVVETRPGARWSRHLVADCISAQQNSSCRYLLLWLVSARRMKRLNGRVYKRRLIGNRGT